MESTTENTNVTPTPVAQSAATPTPVVTPAVQPQQAPVTPAPAAPVAQPQQTPVAPVAPNTPPTAPVINQAAPAPQPAPAPAPTPAPASAPAPATQTQQAPTPIVVQAVTATEAQQENAENEEEEKEKKAPAKLILNTQRIVDDWKFERGKVLIFLMKLMKVFVVLASIGLFVCGFIGVIGYNIAISFLKPVAFLTKNVGVAQIMLLIATFLTVWVSFANKLTPYFKAFSIAKWLKNNEVDPKEVMKIFLQSRREKELTKYIKGRGRINAEKSDLSQAAFILLNENNKKSYKTEMVWSLVFWFLISAAKIAFVYFLSGILGKICLQINEIIEKTSKFDFMKLVNVALDPIFLGVIGGWIVVGITAAIVIACIAHSRNKKQQKWVKSYMKEDMPSEEYYDE